MADACIGASAGKPLNTRGPLKGWSGDIQMIYANGVCMHIAVETLCR